MVLCISSVMLMAACARKRIQDFSVDCNFPFKNRQGKKKHQPGGQCHFMFSFTNTGCRYFNSKALYNSVLFMAVTLSAYGYPHIP